MNNQLQIFEHKDFGTVRVIFINDEPHWVLADVCKVLGLTTTARVAERLDEDEVSQTHTIDRLGRKQKITVITESGLYAVILRSDKPNAKAFRKWVTSEVLPTIRKHGAYITGDTLSEMIGSPEFTEALLDALAEEHTKNIELEDRIDELVPRARFCDKVLLSGNAIQTSIIAKDYGMTAIAFNRLLHELGIQYRYGNTWLLYKEYADNGYTKTKTYHLPNGDSAIHTYWLQKGRLFLFEALSAVGIYPKIPTGRAFIV
jgi:prophage antirepressor-like protein